MKTVNLRGVKQWRQVMHLGLAVVLAGCIFTLTIVVLPERQINVQAATAATTDKSEGRSPAVFQPDKPSSAGVSTAEATSSTLEVFLRWGSYDFITVMTEVFQANHPNVTVVFTRDSDILEDRLQAGTPPDSMQTHVGLEMKGWIDPGYLEPVTQLWEDEGWLEDKFYPDLIDLVSYQGKIYAVPLNMHRGNVLWCNKSIFNTHGLTVPLTFQEFFTVSDQLQTAGITTPLALGNKYEWAAVHLFETILLSNLGPEDYGKLWTGKVAFTDDRVKEALHTFGRMLDYANADYATLDWEEAAQLMVDGEAAMMVTGDWVEGYFRGQGWQPNVDYCWIPAPGTDDSLMLISDAFVMPTNVPNKNLALDWLRMLGSIDFQDQFNPAKPSVPARLDANPDLYGEYIRWSMARIATEALPPSLAHGSAAPQSFVGQAYNIIFNFLTSRNITDTAEALQQAALNAGFWSPVSATWTAVVTPDSGLTEMFDVVQGLTTTVEIPPASVSTTTYFTLTVEPAILPPHVVSSANLDYAQYAFTLDATQEDGTYVSTPFSKSVTVTFHYNPVGLEEDRLFIYYWDGSQWQDAATTCQPPSAYERGQHFVRVAICHLTDFGLFEVNGSVYLPIILKNN